MTMIKITIVLLSALLTATSVVDAQFSCTLQGSAGESTCLAVKGDDGGHCVWCSFSQFGFCVSEDQAEKMEQNIPGIACDRYSGSDDATPQTDDQAPTDDAVETDDQAPPPTDDHTPPTDDKVAPGGDDALPDNFWTCLQKKDSAACKEDSGCTWCNTKAGFGLCMSGPTAESAKHSDWFQCDDNSTIFVNDVQVVDDIYDTACITAWVEGDQTGDSCRAAQDSTGTACEWCSLGGFVNFCLTEEQAEAGQALGVSCADSLLHSTLPEDANSPNDVACMMAYLDNPEEGSCVSAVDSDGAACEWCTFAGKINLCLTREQAAIGEQVMRMQCNQGSATGALLSSSSSSENPYDPTCVLAYLQDSSADGCTAVSDEDGMACQYCKLLSGKANACLTASQAAFAEQMLGAVCGETSEPAVVPETDDVLVAMERKESSLNTDPYDTSCLLAYLQNPTPTGCTAAVDEDGAACEWCSLAGSINLCLTEEQAEMGQAIGIECGSKDQDIDLYHATADAISADEKDMYDTSCVKAFAQGANTKDACTAVSDEDGVACQWCHLQSVADVCLTSTQADVATQLGIWCDGRDEIGNEDIVLQDNVELPDDFFKCLQEYQQGDCESNACTWCNTEVGLGLCLSSPAAVAMKDCNFFDCNYRNSNHELPMMKHAAATSSDPYDLACLSAGMGGDDAATVCKQTVDSEGQACVWCDAAGVFGLCLSSEQADMAGDYLQCGKNKSEAVNNKKMLWFEEEEQDESNAAVSM